ncbi:CYFA0S05e00408g1_1 [Cyberlindnera fabianii]|uniref:CYFA0S05e00408g1_1 n=1 Tax=Cyberlindnera fabianii TaxID=36022 RepID=A0A061AYH1_CYBFA|nr:Respiratory supercomplex factor 2, mitochondrial [Cyberlindnera fabianii]CDR40424.1 CYFA0S05e00408g1_1 [Cyberlindnera fabianii]
MKLLTDEEIDAHWWATAEGGAKGLIAGSLISLGIFKFGARRWPGFPKNLSYSIRTAIAISPPTVAMTIWAEESSNEFDRQMYSGAEGKRLLEEYNNWAALPFKQKFLEGVINNKYKIIVGAWAASMYGSWVFVDRDPIMTKAQKIVQARMYAQFLTVGLLLGSIGLSMYDEKHHPEHYKKEKLSDWERILQEEEERKEAEKSATQYKRTRIYKD